MDSDLLRIEGIMPGGSKSTYTLPIDIYAFGSSAAVGETLKRSLLRIGIPLNVMTLQEATTAAAGQAGRGGGSYGAGGRPGDVNVYLAPAQMENSLNRMFEGRITLGWICAMRLLTQVKKRHSNSEARMVDWTAQQGFLEWPTALVRGIDPALIQS